MSIGKVTTEQFPGDGEMARLMRATDWSATALGPLEAWPEALKVSLRLLLTSRFEMWLGWGPEIAFFYNDAYRPTLGQKHPAALGMPAAKLWAEIWDEVSPRMRAVYERGEATWDRALFLMLERNGYPEETYHTFSYSPVLDEGRVGGLFCAVSEETERVINERRLETLRTLASALAHVESVAALIAGAEAALRRNAKDLPFVLLYLRRGEGAERVLAIGFAAEHRLAPLHLSGGNGSVWPLAGEETVLPIDDAGGLPTGAWQRPPHQAAAVPLVGQGGGAPLGTMIVGLNPHRAFDADCMAFLKLLAGQIASGLSSVAAYEAERERAAALAEAVRLREAAADAMRALNATLEARVATALKEREEIESALRQAQKMEAVGQLTGGIAHDFNNLLTGIIGSLDVMQRKLAAGKMADVDRYVNAATASANRAAALTHRLLAFSRRQPLDPRPVDANRLVMAMEELIRRTIGESIALEMVTAGGLWLTLCDPHQLESALLNLAINARDAMPGGGQLTIETCNARLDNEYAARVRDVTPGQYVCIGVSDTGTGMSADIIAKAFEPFFTTKPIGQGTGLGLSMVYGFVRQSEGYARIYSEPGQGSTIKLYLPRYYGDAPAVATSREEAAKAPADAQGEVVLVVEDEPAVRQLAIDVLEDLGYRTLEAADGPAGLKLLNSGLHIDLLVTDVGLPGLNGRQLADAARARRPGLRILFMTGYAENAAIAGGFLEPGMELITKPFAVDALVARVREILAG